MFLGGSGIGRLSSTLRSSFSHAGLVELPFGNLQVKKQNKTMQERGVDLKYNEEHIISTMK